MSYTEEARKKVQNRITNRMNRISEIKQRMQNRLAFGHDENQNPTNLKSKVIFIVNRAQSIRAKSRQHFSRHKDQWIKTAQERGSRNPEREIFKRQRNRLSRIDKAEHRLIHDAFKEHGQSLPQPRKQNITHEFN
ncbi:MAG: hypothetical protein ACE5GQ_03565 [Nitrospinales bacterium]